MQTRAQGGYVDPGWAEKSKKPVPRAKIRAKMKTRNAKQKQRKKGERENERKKGKKSQNAKRVNAIMLDWERGDPPGLPPLLVRSLVVLRAEFLFPSKLFSFRTGIQPSRVPTTYLLSQNIVGDQ
ncbi:hypothetical protein ACN42_g11446 [Penicillium freii]|uniref:Uncharacterized protein n=1 Tax=Penicillium freii TaxID=48697 RepID=A0A124GPR3_PENFR|nr:hypothetical protein ACN42_g11446 [Penicillium freii]